MHNLRWLIYIRKRKIEKLNSNSNITLVFAESQYYLNQSMDFHMASHSMTMMNYTYFIVLFEILNLQETLELYIADMNGTSKVIL